VGAVAGDHPVHAGLELALHPDRQVVEAPQLRPQREEALDQPGAPFEPSRRHDAVARPVEAARLGAGRAAQTLQRGPQLRPSQVRDGARIGDAEAGEELVRAEVLHVRLQPIEQALGKRRLAAAAPAVDGDQSRFARRFDVADARGQRIEEGGREVIGRPFAAVEPGGLQLR
jgi:hypothetical protein